MNRVTREDYMTRDLGNWSPVVDSEKTSVFSCPLFQDISVSDNLTIDVDYLSYKPTFIEHQLCSILYLSLFL